jgi:hypothetical protein
MRKRNAVNNLLVKSLGFLAIALSGCKSIYMPTTPNAPLFQHENQGQVEFTGFFNGMNLKTAYTPVNHFAVQANGHYVRQFSNSFPDPPQHKYLELAAGGYHCFRNKTVIEFYMGYGQGKSVFQDNNLTSSLLVSAKGHYKKVYAQINLGHHKLNNDMYGICLRVADIRYTYTDANLADLVNTISDHPSIEPYFYLSMKVADHLSFIGHVGLTFIEGDKKQSEEVTMRTNFVNVGVGLRLALGDGTE